MFRIPFLRNLFILALVATCCLPLYTLYVLHPSYHRQLIHETEEESARFASYLVRSLGMEGVVLERDILPADTIEKVCLLQADNLLIKLRFFSPQGEILYSTLPEEIGQVNDKDYFRQVVAKGRIFSKVVSKNAPTADGQLTNIDVVETYVPFQVSGVFGGAIEVYYDITRRVYQTNLLTLRTTLALIGVAVVLMFAISLALRNAGRAMTERQQAEDALRRANEDLERRVAERTQELQEANTQLTGEITERAMAQVALTDALEETRAGREQLDGILRSVSDGLLVTDGELRIVHMNSAAEQMLGVPLEKALGQTLDTLPVSRQLIDALRPGGAALENQMIFDFQVDQASGEGNTVFQARVSALNDGEGLAPGAVLLIHDVTREREVERMKNAFLGMAAHELNTPLSVIIGYTELLSNQSAVATLSTEQVHESLSLVHTKAIALSRLVDDLLDVSRIESGQPLNLEFGSCCLNEVVLDVLKPYQGQGSGHSFELQCPDEPLSLEADCGRLEQVVENLISNAVKYSPHGGRLRVVLDGDDDSCWLTVADQGIGMTAEQLQRVFDRFYRADTSNTAAQGVGLGLSVTRHIVEAHGGEIGIDSRFGEGTRVMIKLPRGGHPG
ncbi:MAG: hypothetical protein C0614_13720 [Desulfuromonas sp.]|nr:MAG: hypothetical protein C0614_13720 [Desulfuromonas sp.]